MLHGSQRNDAANNYSSVAWGFIAAATFFTEPLPSDIHRNRLLGGTHDVRCGDGLRCLDIHTESVEAFR
jgi:hypothetical protein